MLVVYVLTAKRPQKGFASPKVEYLLPITLLLMTFDRIDIQLGQGNRHNVGDTPGDMDKLVSDTFLPPSAWNQFSSSIVCFRNIPDEI